MEGTTTSEGQAQSSPGTDDAPRTEPVPSPTTSAPPATTGEPAPSSEPTTPTGTAPASEDEQFYDPESIKGKPELELAYKDMQRAFTRRMEGFKDQQQAIDEYNRFKADPHGTAAQIASQLGYTLTPRNQGGPVQAPQGGNGQATIDENWQPNSWMDVVNVIEQRAEANADKRAQERFAPYEADLKQLRKSTLETQLDQNCPDWRQYESQMMELLNKHNTLVNDPVTLYRMALPPEVLESRATQKALAKLQTSAQQQPSAGSQTVRTVSDQPQGSTFSDAVNWAKSNLASRGVTGPWN